MLLEPNTVAAALDGVCSHGLKGARWGFARLGGENLNGKGEMNPEFRTRIITHHNGLGHRVASTDSMYGPLAALLQLLRFHHGSI